MLKRALVLFLILVFSFAIFGIQANAQVREGDVSLDISPAHPEANQSVRAYLRSYVIDLGKSYITWLINGEEVAKGVGKDTMTFTSGDTGEQLMLTVNITTIDGVSVTKKVPILSTSVDLIWEAVDSYSPPFYRGKTLVSREGSFKVVAVPNINTISGNINHNNLSYTWKKDDRVQTSFSGWGKNSFTFKNSYLDETNFIEVEVSDITGTVTSAGKTTLQTFTPKIVFYKKDFLFGVELENALSGNLNLNPAGDTIVAIPYFFSPKDLFSKDLSYRWFLNGRETSVPPPTNELSIKGEGGAEGTANVSLSISNVRTMFQEATKRLNVTF